MSLDIWKTNGWLREYSTSIQEVTNLLTLVEGDLVDAAQLEISTDWRNRHIKGTKNIISIHKFHPRYADLERSENESHKK